jgi:hypothetical protein
MGALAGLPPTGRAAHLAENIPAVAEGSTFDGRSGD